MNFRINLRLQQNCMENYDDEINNDGIFVKKLQMNYRQCVSHYAIVAKNVDSNRIFASRREINLMVELKINSIHSNKSHT